MDVGLFKIGNIKKSDNDIKIEKLLHEFVMESNDHEFEFQSKKIEKGYSYKCYNMVWLWILKHPKKITVEFNNTPIDLYDLVKKKENAAILKDGRIIIECTNPLETLKILKDELIYKYNYLRLHEPVECFGCCSQYNECSNQKKCVQKDIKLAKGCAYKRNLDNGSIFYGKNRNVESAKKYIKSEKLAKGLLYLDVEWANPKNKSICQIALISEDFYTGKAIFPKLNLYVNPNDEYDYNCVAIHHITNKKTDNCKTFKELWVDIEKYFINSIIVGHNVKGSDLNAIVKNLKRYDIDIPEIWCIDTYELSRKFINPFEVENYKLSTLCNYFDIELKKEHDAFDDAYACSNLLKKLIDIYDINIDNYIQRYNPSHINEFVPYISSSEFRREMNTLYGVVNGIQLDNTINKKESDFIVNWRDKHKSYIQNNTVKHIIKLLDSILDDSIITIDEANELKNVISLYLQKVKSSKETLATQFLQGLITGIQADDTINDQEIYKLQKWLYTNDYLKGHYPYDILFNKIKTIISDGIITSEEREDLKKVFNEINNPLESLNENIIDFKNKSFCLSGNFNYGTKEKVKQYIISNGGLIDKSLKKATNYLVVGGIGSNKYSNGKYGTKIKKALELNITIIKEEQLFKDINL